MMLVAVHLRQMNRRLNLIAITHAGAQHEDPEISRSPQRFICLPLSDAIAPANAATASNSQAGANGHTSNMEKSTMKKYMVRKHKHM